jgi:hypothetical protein
MVLSIGVSHHSPEDGNKSTFENALLFVFFRMPDYGQSPKNPVIPNIYNDICDLDLK